MHADGIPTGKNISKEVLHCWVSHK